MSLNETAPATGQAPPPELGGVVVVGAAGAVVVVAESPASIGEEMAKLI